jgi:hypothetical protein
MLSHWKIGEKSNYFFPEKLSVFLYAWSMASYGGSKVPHTLMPSGSVPSMNGTGLPS